MAEKNSLWKNIRNKAKRNRETGATPKKPTTEMLRQERKIRAQKAEGGPVGEDELYNIKRAVELGYTPDETGHWPSVDSETGMFLKSKEHPTAFMEYLYGYTLNPELNKNTNVVVNPEGYFGDNQLQYIPKKQNAEGGYYPTQGPGKGLFKGYARGGKDEEELPTYRYANKEGVIGGPRQTNTGTALPVGLDGLPIVNMPEFEVISTGLNSQPNPYSPVTGEEYLSSGYNPINLFLPPQVEKQQQPIDPITGMPLPQSGKADYDYATEMMLALPAANAVKKGSALLKNAKQELIYNAIDPVGYGVREKLGNIPQNLVRNTFKPNERIARVGKELSPFDLPGSEIVKSRGKARLDSWRLGLGLDQKHNTFNKIGDNLYSTNAPNPIEGRLSHLYNDIQANKINKTLSGDEAKAALRELTRTHNSLTANNGPLNNVNAIREHLRKSGDLTFMPWEQSRIVEKARNPKFTHSVYDADPNGIMGQHRFDVTDLPDNNIHFQANDTWDLHPFADRGVINVGQKIAGEEGLKGIINNRLKNVEALKILGGKPFNIQDNFIVNPNTMEVVKRFDNGGYIYPDGGRTGPGNPGYIKPTRLDSLMLFNSALEKIKFYKGNPDYKKMAKSSTNFKDTSTRQYMIKKSNSVLNKVDAGLIEQMALNTKAANKPLTPLETKKLKQQLNKVKFGKVPNSNLTSFGDILHGEPDTHYNPLAPSIYLHSSIEPQGSEKYYSSRWGDTTDIPYYDPIAVAPFDTLNDKEKEIRLQKYGPSGIPKSYIDSKKNNTTISTPTQVDKLESLKLTNLPTQEAPLELNLKTPTSAKRKAAINRGANSSFDADGNPLVSEVNFGDGTGWHSVPYNTLGDYEEIKATGGYTMKNNQSWREYLQYAKGGKYLTADGIAHKVYRNADGDIMVNHPKNDYGKFDTLNLTDKSDANTIAEGVASVRKWHRENPSYAQGGYTNPYNQYQKDPYLNYAGGGFDNVANSVLPAEGATDAQAMGKFGALQQLENAGYDTANQLATNMITNKLGSEKAAILNEKYDKWKNIPIFGKKIGMAAQMFDLASGKAKDRLEDYDEQQTRQKQEQEEQQRKLTLSQPTINQNLSFSAQGGTVSNNSLNLRNTMRNKRFAKGGTFDQFGINLIPDSAGLHHESAYGGVPIGPNALAEGGEAKLQMEDGGQYIVSGEVDGANTQSINGETMTQRLKKKLKPFMMGGLASNPKDKENVRRPFDSYSEPSIDQAKNAAIQETEAVKMQRGGALQYAANGGKLNKDIEKIVMEEYSAAYGGMLPNKYKGKVNMPNSYSKGGIHIKESKKGTFTAAATKHGKGVQEFARQVLANKENYSPAMVKKANFAHNASKWHHADGGYVYNPMTQPMLAEGGPSYPKPSITNNQVQKYIDDMEERGMTDPGKQFQTTWQSDLQNRAVDLSKELNSTDLERVKSLYNFRQQNKNPLGFAEGGPIYGDPASEYVYAMGGMYGDPYARGGQINYTNDMYAGGGPMVSNVKQPFRGPAAQNRGGMYIYADGGMMPQEQQMMQQEQMQQQGGQDQMMQMIQQIAQAIMQGENPEQIMAELANSGMPAEQVQQIMQAAMQIAFQQQQQQPMQQGQQMMPQQGMMSSGGRLPKDILRARVQSHMSPEKADAYVNSYSKGGKMHYDGGGTFGPITEAEAIASGYQPSFQDEIDYTQIPNFNTPIIMENLNSLKLPTYSTDNLQLPNNKLQDMPVYYNNPVTREDSNWTTYTGTGTGTPKTIYAPENPIQYKTVGENDFNLTDPFASQNTKEINLPNSNSFTQGTIPTDIQNIISNNTVNNNNVNRNTDTPWFEEPWYSQVARYSQAIPGIAATITAMKNKKRKLDPAMMTAQKVDYTVERINDAKQSRLKYNKYADTVRNMGNQGYANMKDALLNYNADLAGRNAESVMREANTNAQLAQQADLTNTGTKNQFKQLNEQMFQNAQTQALAGLGDTTGKAANAAAEERKQYLQEWIARNRLGTRSYKTNINGQDVFVNADGQIYDAKTGTLLSAG